MKSNNLLRFFLSVSSGLLLFAATANSTFGQSTLSAPVTAQAICGDPTKIDTIAFVRFQGEFSSTNAGVVYFCNDANHGGGGPVRLGDALLTTEPQMLYQDGAGGLYDLSPTHLAHLIPQASLPPGVRVGGGPWKYSTDGGFVTAVDGQGLTVGYGNGDTPVHVMLGGSMLKAENLSQPVSPSAAIASHCGQLLETTQGFPLCLFETGTENYLYRPSVNLAGVNFAYGETLSVGFNPRSIAIVGGNNILVAIPSTTTSKGSLNLIDISGNVIESDPLDITRPSHGFLSCGVAGCYVTADGGNGYDEIWWYRQGNPLFPLAMANYGESFGSPLALK